MYTIKAIPTTYAGVNFRSRLEARWAAFFDLCGWRWDYEPVDLDGWIPDFILQGRKERVLIEVKPLYVADESLFHQLSRQATRAGFKNDILVLGAGINRDTKYWTCCSLGWLGEYCGGEHGWADAIPHTGRGLGFCSSTCSYRNRMTGYHDGDDGAGSDTQDSYISRLWREAGNIVQWQPERRAA